MSTSLTGPVAKSVETVNAVQDRVVSAYVAPYSVTAAYWALGLVFLYLGVQKAVPPRSTADIQLATIAGVLGLPYIPFVTFVGVWQMIIGGLFLLRRLRLCAWFFFSYQFFTMSTLVVLRQIVFQPPWLTVFGIDVPWALGSYAAFILKNLVVIGTFFVLVSLELDPADPAAGSTPVADGAPERSGRSRLRTVLSPVASGRSRSLRWLRERTAAIRRAAARVVERIHAGQDYLVANYFRPHCVAFLYVAFAFVFFYFGFQKPSPAYSPVRTPMADFLPHFGIALETGMLFIGTYEMFLGLLFLFREIRAAFWLFLPHQAVTFLSLLVIPFVAFQPPWISVFGVELPWALTGYGAFVVKNVVFVAGFTLLLSVELGDGSPAGCPAPEVSRADSVNDQVDQA